MREKLFLLQAQLEATNETLENISKTLNKVKQLINKDKLILSLNNIKRDKPQYKDVAEDIKRGIQNGIVPIGCSYSMLQLKLAEDEESYIIV